VEQRTQFVDLSDGGRRGGPQMLKPKPGFLTTPQDKFQQAFWCSAETGGRLGLSARPSNAGCELLQYVGISSLCYAWQYH
jgi:hypothetical protein